MSVSNDSILDDDSAPGKRHRKSSKKKKRSDVRQNVLRKWWWFKKKRVGELGEESHRIVPRVDGAALVGRDCRGARVWGRFFSSFLMCRENVSVWFLKMSPTKRRKRNAREHVERRTDDLFLFLYETVFWLLSRGVVIAPRRRRRRARVSIIARESIVHGRCFVVFRVSQPLSFFFVSQKRAAVSCCFFCLHIRKND